MKKMRIRLLSLLLSIVMVIGIVSCGPKPDDETTGSESATETEGTAADSSSESGSESTSEDDGSSESASSSETETETETETVIEAPVLEGPDGSIITHANKLANGIQVYFDSAKRENLIIENLNMKLEYALGLNADKQVKYIKNTKGNTYIENTMDVFVKMKGNDQVYYSTSSSTSPTMNLYRFGYYYYETRLQGQTFIDSDISVESSKDLRIKAPDALKQFSEAKKDADGNFYVTMTDASDPQIIFNVNYAAADYNYIAVTMKVNNHGSAALTGSTVYFSTDSAGGYSESRKGSFKISADGEYHTVYVKLSSSEGYEGKITKLRFDPAGSVGDEFSIKSIEAVKIAETGSPEHLLINRLFHAYSDKNQQVIQVTAQQDTTDIEYIGLETKIAADTVDKIIVKDKSKTHTSLEGVDWDSAEYVGFDIKDTGIFGYILLPDETSGKMTVTLNDGVYTITQLRAPEDNMIPAANEDILNLYDFFMGQRIYTDESHDFDKFLVVAEGERNPIPDQFIKVDQELSDGGLYLGYNALRGAYEFTLNDDAFNGAYYTHWNQHLNLDFTIRGDKLERDIYIMTSNGSGQLECAVVLNKGDQLLPVPVEVCKNFADGAETIYNYIDTPWNETFFPIHLGADERCGFNFIHLYQNWGQYPLKQVSSIQFPCPYYHLSTGVTETNCILPWYSTGGARSFNTLPDHRAMSAPFWLDQPQHTSGGDHRFLRYTDSEGRFSGAEVTKNTITSYGPTYAEVIMDYLSDDGRIAVKYTHMEMPETDENRTYYTMEYEVLEDISFNDFKNDFNFYSVDDNGHADYQSVGFLDENNECATRPINEKSDAIIYKLGTECPYFSLYRDDDPQQEDGYVNLSFLIFNSSFVIGGKQVSPSFVIRDVNKSLSLSLDLEKVTLKAGDKFTINAIIMPWGSQESDYTKEDKNVRDVRENTLLNPLTLTAGEGCKKIESVFLPKAKTLDGVSAEFTLTGGYNNCVTEIQGFTSLTTPMIFEKVGDEWVRYNISSQYTLDKKGNGADYDGFGVAYIDGFFAYSFVCDMTEHESRTFKMIVDKSQFEEEPKPDDFVEGGIIEDGSEILGTNLEFGAKDIQKLGKAGNGFSKIELNTDKDGTEYVSFYGDNSRGEAAFVLFNAANFQVPLKTGQYFVLKYRVPTTNADKRSIEVFSSTIDNAAKSGHSVWYGDLIRDDQWHVLVLDFAKLKSEAFPAETNGAYYAKYVRFDVFNAVTPKDHRIDIAYMAFDDNFEDILKTHSDLENVTYFDGENTTVPTEGGKLPVRVVLEDDTSPNTTPFDIYLSGKKIAFNANKAGSGKGEITYEEESFARIRSNAVAPESYYSLFKYNDGEEAAVGGRYLVVKYRASKVQGGWIQFYTSTTTTAAGSSGDVSLTAEKGPFITDGEWKILIIDLSKTVKTYTEDENGKYAPRFLRFDAFNSKIGHTDAYIDVAFIAFTDSLDIAKGYDTSVTPSVYVGSTSSGSTGDSGSTGGSGSTGDSGSTDTTPTFEDDKSENTTPFNIYLSAKKLAFISSRHNYRVGELQLNEAEGYMTYVSNPTADETRIFVETSSGAHFLNHTASGKYMVIKYRIPKGQSTWLELFVSTQNTTAKAGDNITLTAEKKSLTIDGEWHITVVDMSKLSATFTPDVDGKYTSTSFRFDPYNYKVGNADHKIDVGFIAFTDDLNTAVTFDRSVAEVAFMDKVDGNVTVTTYSSSDGTVK